MIPINAPVTVVINNNRINGILVKLPSSGYHVKDGDKNIYHWCLSFEPKIRIDNAAPFTLWQLNALCGDPANSGWVKGYNLPNYVEFLDGYPRIGPHQIAYYWEYFDVFVSK